MRIPTLIVTKKGGRVQSVASSRPDLLSGFKVVVVDYDTEGAPLEDIVQIAGADGDMATAAVSVQPVEALISRTPERGEGYFWTATVKELLDYLAKALELYEGPLVISRENGGFLVRGMD